MSMPDYRTAGVLLLLTALATAISVPARLAAGADATPLADVLAQSQNLDAVALAQIELSEKLSAIGSAKAAYATGGVARLLGGVTLLAGGILLWRVLRAYHPAAAGLTATMFAISGIASAVSGASAIALAVLAPEPQSTVVLTPGSSLVSGTEEALFTIRWASGALGFTLAGLALVALAAVQWKMGRLLQASGIVVAVLGIAMLFIWLDAATVAHRITGVGFLIWLILVGLWLVAGRVRQATDSLSR